MTTEQEARLDDALAAYLRGESDRQSLLDTNPDLADELRSFFADQDRVARLAAPLRRPAWPSSVGPYDVVGEIARGGMGVVLLARHRAVGREVALKWLLGGRHAEPDDVQRFRREATAVAGLDHPHIVPIYEVGEHDGVPYFAMKRLRCSLADERKRRPIPPPEATRLVGSIARALHHAHQRGVLHRDIKSSNVLLDDAGVPSVADFGLARKADAERLTGTGAVLGTPAYMAPEQARGEAVTVASDVYSLGAVLYELLAGRPPFTGPSPVEVLRRVIDDDPPPPPGPRDLVAIALKCLDKDPVRRYASAAELADDLDRSARGELVRARRAGLRERLWRAARRRPGVTLLAAALVAAVVTGAALVGQQWRRAEDALVEARDALTKAERERDNADKSFRQAHRAVHEFCVSFADELAQVPGMQGLRQRLLHQAKLYFEDFVAQREGNASLRRELADTHVEIARMTNAIGERRAARAAYLTALAIYRELHAESPDDPVLWRKLAGTVANVAICEDRGPSLVRLQEAEALYAEFLRRAPDDLDLASGLALAKSNRATLLLALGKTDEARAALEDAIARQEALPPHDLSLTELAGSIDNLGVVLDRAGRRDEALCAHLRAEAIRRRLADDAPRDARRACALAATRHHIGLVLHALGQPAAGNKSFNRALAARRKVAGENPLVVQFQTDLAASLSFLAQERNREAKRDAGLDLYQQARRILERQVQLDPGNPSLRAQLGDAWFNVGVTLGAMNRRPEEGDAFERARALQRGLLDADPDGVERRAALSRTLNNLGINLAARGRDAEAVPVFEEAIQCTSDLSESDPGRRRLLTGHLALLASSRATVGDWAAARDAAGRRGGLWPGDPGQLFKAACETARLAGRAPAGERGGLEEDAMALLRQAVRAGFRDAKALAASPDLRELRKRAGFNDLLGG